MQTTELSAKYQRVAEAVESLVGASVSRIHSSVGELTYQVESSAIVDVCTQLRDAETLCFEMLMDVCGVDYLTYGRDEWDSSEATATGFSRSVSRDLPAGALAAQETGLELDPPGRFAVVYHLMSVTHNHRVRLKVFCESDDRPMLPSVVGVWNCAEWYEREAFDLYGILFRGHPDLRRILTDYGFIGHPFRKDFPLVGNVEMRYDPEKERVVYQPVSIEPRTLVPKVIRQDARYEGLDREETGDA